MQKTLHYELKKPEITDQLRVTDFNENSDLIDAALASKAEKSAVTAMETALANYKTSNDAAVASKAGTAEVSALSQSVTALATALGSGGSNCRIATGSYTGNGTYGASNAITLNFGFKPLMVAVGCDYCATNDTNPSVLLRGQTKAPSNWGCSSGESSLMQLTWTNTGVSFYNERYAGYQNNEPDVVYYWVAIGI